MKYKFGISFLLLVLALFLQILIGETSGVWIGFALAVLVASAFFVDAAELFVLISFAVLALNWQPAPSWELAAFVLLSLAAFGLYKSRLLPFKPWLVNAIAIAGCVLVFYAIFGIGLFVSEPRTVLLDVLATIFAGMGFFSVLHFAQTSESHDMLR